MKNVYTCAKKSISRRTALRVGGACLALPMLDAMTPAFAAPSASEPPRRMIAINVDLGFIPERFFPEQTGRGYALSPYLKELADFREEFTVFSGLHHPGTGGLHDGDKCFLTAAKHPKSPGFKNTISLDQRMAEEIGHLTRWPSLTLRTGPGSNSLSYTPDGVRIPAIQRPSEVFEKLFVQGTPQEVKAQVQRLKEGRSLMDRFGERVTTLRNRVGASDRRRLDQYFTSLREMEKRLETQEAWAAKPKPVVDAKMPRDNTSPGGVIPQTTMHFDMARLALETDSTRLITVLVNQGFNPKVNLPGVNMPHHALTHQYTRPEQAEELAIIETAQMRCLAGLLKGLRDTRENGATLLDNTMVLQGSNIGIAGRHDGNNLPIVLAGGGFKHGAHVGFDRKHNEALAKVFVTMLHRMGIEDEQFATGSRPISGLELA